MHCKKTNRPVMNLKLTYLKSDKFFLQRILKDLFSDMDEERKCSTGDPDLKVQQYLEQVILILCPQHFDDVWRCLRIWLRQTNHDYQEEEDHDTGAVDDDSEYYLFCHIEQLYSAGSRLGSSASNYNWCWYRPPRTTGIHICVGGHRKITVSFELKNPQKACYTLIT